MMVRQESIMRFIPTALLVAGSLGCALAAHAGTAHVAFVNAPSFSDAGGTTDDERKNLDALARHVQSLAQRLLPADHALKVEVLDVDLAGTVLDTRRGTSLTRVIRGGADFPRLRLRYTLEQNGRVVRSGEDALADLNYSRGMSGSYRQSQPLHYEKRMLETWFKEQLVGGRQAG
jgi:hypothetical protein